eukprot:COSAG04_NODE_5465_length_1608_cov_2.003313_2_plen_303_part_01
MALGLLLSLALGSPIAAAGSAHEVHVGPGQEIGTLGEALRRAAARGPSPSASAPLTVHVHGAAATPASELPLVLGPEHSHLSIVGGTVSGGVSIPSDAWKKLTGADNVWAATTPAGLPSARQLYVDGARANRTMLWWPRSKFSVAGSSLVSSDSAAAAALLSLGPSEPASQLEAVFTGGGKEHSPHAAPGQSSYREARCPVASVAPLHRSAGVNSSGVNMTLAEPCYSRARYLSSCSTPSYISNSRQLLVAGGAAPGSFFFDSGKSELLLAAPAGWQPSKSEVILPVNETLLRVKAGTKGVSF